MRAARRERAARQREWNATLVQARRDRENEGRYPLDVLKLWRGCAHPQCRRAHACRGDFVVGPRCCADMSDMEKDWVRGVFPTITPEHAADGDPAETRLRRHLQDVALQFRLLRLR
jgi:hypothetical protein